MFLLMTCFAIRYHIFKSTYLFSLEQAGQNATALIHEATFEDCLHDEALEKRHCTISEAIDVGTRCVK